MSETDEVRRDAEKTGELVSRKLMQIMDLQADIDALLRDKHPPIRVEELAVHLH
jgi:hypothetical protein